MFIQLKKIREVVKKGPDGKTLLNPSDDTEIKEDVVVDEAIDVFAIKSVRKFDTYGRSHRNIKGDICVIYLKGSGPKTTELHVVAVYEDLIKEVNDLKGRKSS